MALVQVLSNTIPSVCTNNESFCALESQEFHHKVVSLRKNEATRVEGGRFPALVIPVYMYDFQTTAATRHWQKYGRINWYWKMTKY